MELKADLAYRCKVTKHFLVIITYLQLFKYRRYRRQVPTAQRLSQDTWVSFLFLLFYFYIYKEVDYEHVETDFEGCYRPQYPRWIG